MCWKGEVGCSTVCVGGMSNRRPRSADVEKETLPAAAAVTPRGASSAVPGGSALMSRLNPVFSCRWRCHKQRIARLPLKLATIDNEQLWVQQAVALSSTVALGSGNTGQQPSQWMQPMAAEFPFQCGTQTVGGQPFRR